mgnify:CR=1 FL=1
MDLKSKIILISGPTASGKSSFAIKVAKKVDGEIINADSMQLYKGLPLLTAMPSPEDRRVVPHELYEVLPPYKNTFSVAQWVDRACQCIRVCLERGQRPWVVGGTGFYLQFV